MYIVQKSAVLLIAKTAALMLVNAIGGKPYIEELLTGLCRDPGTLPCSQRTDLKNYTVIKQSCSGSLACMMCAEMYSCKTCQISGDSVHAAETNFNSHHFWHPPHPQRLPYPGTSVPSHQPSSV